MIHYHGTPITPSAVAEEFLARRHAFVSFEDHRQDAIVAQVCQSFALDNGAFSKWRAGEGRVDVAAYCAWVSEWCLHPGFDFAVIPDVIDGDEMENEKMCARWLQAEPRLPHGCGAPVWHLHESFKRLEYLIRCTQAGIYNRVCLGSSGQWETPGTEEWWGRMDEVRAVACDEFGRPRCRLHGLRMLNATIFSQIPLSSADSTNVARNIGLDVKMPKAFRDVSTATRARIFAERIELHASAATWSKRHGTQQNLELIG